MDWSTWFIVMGTPTLIILGSAGIIGRLSKLWDNVQEFNSKRIIIHTKTREMKYYEVKE